MTIEADEPSTVAALAGTVAALGVRLSLVAATADAAAARSTVETLAEQVARLSETVDEVLDAESPKGPPAIGWTGMDEDEYRKTRLALTDWVNGILLPGYPTCGLLACWPGHPQAVTELGNLWQEWRHIYERRRPDLKLSLEWHDRWFPGAMARIERITLSCITGCQVRRD